MRGGSSKGFSVPSKPLQRIPTLGRKVPEAGRDEIRELVFQGYRIIYLTKPEKIFVITVLHGSRDLAGQAPKPWDIV